MELTRLSKNVKWAHMYVATGSSKVTVNFMTRTPPDHDNAVFLASFIKQNLPAHIGHPGRLATRQPGGLSLATWPGRQLDYSSRPTFRLRLKYAAPGATPLSVPFSIVKRDGSIVMLAPRQHIDPFTKFVEASDESPSGVVDAAAARSDMYQCGRSEMTFAETIE